MEQILWVDAELETCLKQNRREAFEYFYDRYSPALYGSIYTVVSDEAIAVQLLEEAFLDFWRNIRLYDSSFCSIEAWALKICRKKAMGYKQSGIMLSN